MAKNTDPKHPDNKKILDYIVAKHAPFVQRQINSLRKTGHIPPDISDEELMSSGIHGLLKAFHTYDPKIGADKQKEDENPFLKHASFWVKGKIREQLSTNDPVGRRLRRKINILDANQATQTTKQPEQQVSEPTPPSLPKPPQP